MTFVYILKKMLGAHGVYLVGLLLSVLMLFFSFFTPSIRSPFDQVYVSLLPLQDQLHDTFSFPKRWVQYQQSGMSRITDLEARNAELRTRIAESEFLRQENQELKNVLGNLGDLDNTGVQRVTVARIISNTDQQHTIDQGLAKGVKSGDIVLSNGAFVGVVSQVENEFSQIHLLTEGTLRVLATTLKGVNGVLLARNHTVFFTEVPLDADVEIGEYIYSLANPLSQVPSGLVIGQVKDVQQDQSMATKTVTVEMLGHTDSFQLVLVGRK